MERSTETDSRDYKQFLRGLSSDRFRKFVLDFGGEANEPDDLVKWVNSAEREKAVCDKIRRVFGVEILTGSERQEAIAKTSGEATIRQAVAAERANETAEKALRVAEASMLWTKVAGIVAFLGFLLSIIGLLK